MGIKIMVSLCIMISFLVVSYYALAPTFIYIPSSTASTLNENYAMRFLNDIQYNIDSLNNNGYNATRGNGWNEEHPSVESDVIWRKYYTGGMSQ